MKDSQEITDKGVENGFIIGINRGLVCFTRTRPLNEVGSDHLGRTKHRVDSVRADFRFLSSAQLKGLNPLLEQYPIFPRPQHPLPRLLEQKISVNGL
jgi:hypothetical protein